MARLGLASWSTQMRSGTQRGELAIMPPAQSDTGPAGDAADCEYSPRWQAMNVTTR
jgi:hypothetical protein